MTGLFLLFANLKLQKDLLLLVKANKLCSQLYCCTSTINLVLVLLVVCCIVVLALLELVLVLLMPCCVVVLVQLKVVLVLFSFLLYCCTSAIRACTSTINDLLY